MDTSILDEVEVGTRTPKQTARQRNRMDDVMEKLFEHLEKQCAFARGGTGRGRRWFEQGRKRPMEMTSHDLYDQRKIWKEIS